MSTRQERSKRLSGRLPAAGESGRHGLLDGAEAVAFVARSRREMLLAFHRHRLTREDLEDCYSQATLELLTRAGRGEAFSSNAHIANALEQRLLSRIHDRRRALSGRSPIEAAIAEALPITDCERGRAQIADARADVERLTILRHDLQRIREISAELSHDQRLVLASQLAGDSGCREFCRVHGWSAEKYRKVAQRARRRLAQLLADDQPASCLKSSARIDVTPTSDVTRSVGGAVSSFHLCPLVPLAPIRRTRAQGPIYENHSPPT